MDDLTSLVYGKLSADEERREDLLELQLLVESADARSVGVITGSRRSPDRKFFVGTGKAEELAAMVAATEANVVIFISRV